MALQLATLETILWFNRNIVMLELWPKEIPLVVQIVMAIIIGDFIPYWAHRISHENSKVLWKLHRIHHSPKRIYWLNAARIHPINLAYSIILSLTPILILGAGKEVLFITGLITTLHSFASHTNIDFRLGILNWFFSMNELHRWHHANNSKEGNTNYGGTTIIWDIVFGTRYLPPSKFNDHKVGLESYDDYSMNFKNHFGWQTQKAKRPKINILEKY